MSLHSYTLHNTNEQLSNIVMDNKVLRGLV